MTLNDAQKRALIFIREAGAIDNASNRQLNGIDVLKASGDLRSLREKNILLQKGKGRSTYYIPNLEFILWNKLKLSTPVDGLSVPPYVLNEPVDDLSEPVGDLSEPVRLSLVNQLPAKVAEKLPIYTGRIANKTELEEFICELCSIKEFSINELSLMLNKGEKYLLFNFIKPLRESERLAYTHPEMPNHPQQAYKTVINS